MSTLSTQQLHFQQQQQHPCQFTPYPSYPRVFPTSSFGYQQPNADTVTTTNENDLINSDSRQGEDEDEEHEAKSSSDEDTGDGSGGVSGGASACVNSSLTSESATANTTVSSDDVIRSQQQQHQHQQPSKENGSISAESATDTESLAAVVNFKSKSRANGGGGGMGGGGRNQKRQRTKFDQRQLDILEAAFTRTHYPDINIVDRLADTLGLTVERISVWFQNRRARYKRSSKNPAAHQPQPTSSSSSSWIVEFVEGLAMSSDNKQTMKHEVI